MTCLPRGNAINLPEISTRNRHARHIIAGFSLALPTLAEIWRVLDRALTDTLTLAEEISRQRADLAAVRLDRANLLAAIHAALAAARDGEADPLAYLHDELDDRSAEPGRRG